LGLQTVGKGSTKLGSIVFRDDLVARQTDYFGAPLTAPAWRAKWVEKMEAVTPTG